MTRFIPERGNSCDLINLDHVATFRAHAWNAADEHGFKSPRSYRAYSAAGEVLGEVSSYIVEDDLPTDKSPNMILPDAHGCIQVQVQFIGENPNEAHHDTDADFAVDRVPIIGWLFEDGWCLPLTPGHEDKHVCVVKFIEYPATCSPRWVFSESRDYDDYAAALNHARKEALAAAVREARYRKEAEDEATPHA